MKILVTGGAGFIGSNFVRGMSGSHKITVLDALTYSGNTTNLHKRNGPLDFVCGDICNGTLVNDLTQGQDMVIHFAAESHVDRSIADASDFVRTNVMGTQVLLDAAVRHDVGRFIYVSTDEVYGSIDEGSWDESAPLDPNSPYAASKAAGDMLARAYHRTHGLPVIVTRGSNTYGPYQYPEKIIPLFITNLMQGKTVPLYGDGMNVRDWLHVDDHCRGIWWAAMKGTPGDVYNVGGGTELTNWELTGQLLNAMGSDWDQVEMVPDRKGHDRRYSLDATKLAALGYKPEVDFHDGLERTVRWYQENRTWWEPLCIG